MIINVYWLIPPVLLLTIVAARAWWEDGESTSHRGASLWRRKRR